MRDNKDFTELTQVLNSSRAEVEDIIADVNPELDRSSLIFDVADAIQVYLLLDVNIFASFSKNSSFRDLISDEYIWLLPLEEAGLVIQFTKEDGNWAIAGINNELAVIPTATEKYDLENLLSVVEAAYDDVGDIRFVRSYDYFTDFLFFTSQGSEYIVPYTNRSDLTGLDNGKVYPVGTALEILENSFAEDSADAGYGGLGSASPNLLYIGGFTLLVGLFASIYFFVRKQ